ncbi:lactadherin-like [Watersipora subatra]|uniref:lactadherin-like n=1 Tax=Watersipora subatra TaxID=2589382 RepID=UPI00355B6EDC
MAFWRRIGLVNCLAIIITVTNGCVNNGPLGMISGDIQDWQVTASSSYPNEWDRGCHISNARPYLENGKGWCARLKSQSEWIQIDLGVQSTVTGVITQGRGDGMEWVSQYLISYSPDGQMWNYVTDSANLARVFEGNSDSYTVQHNYLPSPILARYVKVQVHTWHKHPSMRVELIGCQDSKKYLGQPPYGSLTASTSRQYKRGSSCQPGDGHILSNKAWCAAHNNDRQWLQLDVGPPSLVTAIVTKGRGDTGRKQWVTKYRIAYSNDSVEWSFYKVDETHGKYALATVTNETNPYAHQPNIPLPDRTMEFGGNIDKDSERVNYLSKPFIARYIRIYPITWYRDIALRLGVLGKPHEGACAPGFTRPNSESPCVENLAFQKETWLNKERHRKRALDGRDVEAIISQKLAEKAVDGVIINDINSCAILDNYYDAEPQLTIDLGARRDVSGVTIYTWQGQKDKSDIYNKDYALHLESLNVYISSSKTGEVLCGEISNSNNELILQQEQKVTCSRRINGRYIRIQPNGRTTSLSNWYSAVICEVMAFT